MAVYTQFDDTQIRGFAARYGLDGVTAIEGIVEGVQNTNYRLAAHGDKYILTVFEKMTDGNNLPYFMNLMDHMNRRGVPCPKPLRDPDGAIIGALGDKKAAIVTHLDGDWPRGGVETWHCAALGETLAKMHLAVDDFDGARENDLSIDGWRRLFDACRDHADEVRPGLADMIDAELSALERHWPRDLPTGAVHTDQFPNNVFFENTLLTGVIDFYFAANDAFAYDLAICINAWCFGEDHVFLPVRAAALLDAYRNLRPLSEEEITAMPVLARGAAMRFLATRLHDWLHAPDDAVVERLDPLEYVAKLEFHRNVESPAQYGLAA